MPSANTLILPRRSHKKLAVVLVSAVIAVVVVLVLLSMNWPFTRQAVIKSLAEASSSKVEIGRFQSTYFPTPGCVAEGVTFRRNSDPSTPPLITVGKLTIRSSFPGLLAHHVSQIRAEGLHIVISASDTAKNSSSASKTVIDEIVANGAILEFPRTSDNPPLIFSIHESALHDVGASRSLSFDVKFTNPEPPGEITAHGHLGPWKVGDAGQTPVSGDYTFQNADLSVFHGIAGMLSSRGKFQGTLAHIGVRGSTATPDFEVTSSRHRVPLESQFDAFVNGENGDVALQQVKSAFRKTTVISSGSVAGTPQNQGKTAIIDIESRNGRIQDILRLFVTADEPPMSGAVSLRARATIPPGTRPFLKKVELLGDFGIDAGSFKPDTQQDVNKLSAASKGETDENPATVLSDLKGHVVLREGVATFSNLSFGVPGASAEMHGTYSLLTGAIDLHGTLKMDSDLSKMEHGVKSVLLKAISPLFTKKTGGSSVPFKITGTYEHPSFGLELSGNKEDKASKRLQRLYTNTK